MTTPLIARDGEQERREIRAFGEPRRCFGEGEKCLLHQIFCDLSVARQSNQETEDARPMTRPRLVERRRFAATERIDEVSIFHDDSRDIAAREKFPCHATRVCAFSSPDSDE